MTGTDNQLELAGCDAFYQGVDRLFSQGANSSPACLVPVFRIGLGSHFQHELFEAIVDYFLGWGRVIRVVSPEPVNKLAAPPMGGDGHGQGNLPVWVEPDVGQQRLCRLDG